MLCELLESLSQIIFWVEMYPALFVFVIKFVVRGTAKLTSTGAVVLLVHLCK